MTVEPGRCVRRNADRTGKTAWWTAATWFLIMVLLGAVGTACGGRSPTPRPSAVSTPGSPLEHRLGSYAIGPDPGQLSRAVQAGVTLVLGQTTRFSPVYWQTLERTGTKIIDTTPQQLIYQAMCPRGPTSCHVLSDSEQLALIAAVRQHAAAMRMHRSVIGYYILDDYWTNMATVLPRVYTALHSVDPQRPTFCALSLPIAPLAGGSAVTSSLIKFRVALHNYSPLWCKAVMIYSYVPGAPHAVASSSGYDWSMESTLPKALAELRGLGWDPRSEPLVGVPQAFGYLPRTATRTSRVPVEYRPPPTGAELTTQVRSFCANGASAIVAYAWDDGAYGRTVELSSSEALRSALRQGVAACRAKYW